MELSKDDLITLRKKLKEQDKNFNDNYQSDKHDLCDKGELTRTLVSILALGPRYVNHSNIPVTRFKNRKWLESVIAKCQDAISTFNDLVSDYGINDLILEAGVNKNVTDMAEVITACKKSIKKNKSNIKYSQDSVDRAYYKKAINYQIENIKSLERSSHKFNVFWLIISKGANGKKIMHIPVKSDVDNIYDFANFSLGIDIDDKASDSDSDDDSNSSDTPSLELGA